MAANRKKNESGQSVVEFLLTMPLLVGLTLLMIQVSSVIQVSIVHQRYVRAQTLFLAMNSPHFPQVSTKNRPLGKSNPSQTNRMILGVSNDPFSDDEGVSLPITPVAPAINISSSKKKAEDAGEAGALAKKRRNVRVWTTVSLCSASYWQDPIGGSAKPISSVPANISPNGFNYCEAPIDKSSGGGATSGDDEFLDESDT